MKRLLLSTALIFPCVSFALTNAEMEQSLIQHIHNMQKWSPYGDNYLEDALAKERELFQQALLTETKQPSTLNYPFLKLQQYMTIATSADGKLRVYSWDKEMGGTVHFFANIYQFQGADGKVYSINNALPDGDSGARITDVLPINIPYQTLYLLRSTATLSTSLSYESIKLVGIDSKSLSDKKLIKTRSGLTNTLGFEYDFFSVVDKPERPIKLTVYDKTSNTIKIPVVLADKKFNNGGRVTSRYINYQFDGAYFTKQ